MTAPTTDQDDLFGPYGGEPPYRRGHETQRLAARSVADTAPTKRERVFLAIEHSGRYGMTNDEIVEELGFLLQSVCARVAELRETDRIKDSTMRRLTKTGRQAIVWVTNRPQE